MLYDEQELCDSLTDDVIDDVDKNEITVISTQIIHLEIPVTPTIRTAVVQESPEEVARRTRINRIVGFFASLIFLTCVVLVCASLMMSKDIDELVRQSNFLLRKHTLRNNIRPHGISVIRSTVRPYLISTKQTSVRPYLKSTIQTSIRPRVFGILNSTIR